LQGARYHQQTVADLGNRLDEPWIVGIVLQDVPQHRNAARQGILAHKSVWPDGAENLVF
jgi:hypothetical protein